MKQISKRIFIHDEHFANVVPPEVDFLPVSDTDLPVYYHEQALDPAICDEIAGNMLGRGATHPLATVGREGDRKTLSLTISDREMAAYNEAMALHIPAINDFFNLDLLTSDDGAQVLGYPPGARYGGHSDNCTPVFDDNGRFSRFECLLPHRVISTILFLTDSVGEITAPNQCVGGNVSFNHLYDSDGELLIIEPKKGLLVAFPSNPYFGHEVHEVYDGYRISIVEWFDATFRQHSGS